MGVPTRTIQSSVQIANNLSEEARAVVEGIRAHLLTVVRPLREEQEGRLPDVWLVHSSLVVAG